MTTAVKQYKRNLMLAMGSYILILFGVNTYLSSHDLPQWQQTLLALLPMLPVYLVLKAILTFARSWDELQRKKAMESMLISFGVTGFGTFGYGFLEGVGFPPFPTIWILPIMMAIYGLAQFFVVRRY